MTDSPNVAIVKEYFRRSDARRPDVFEVLHDDIEFYFPKYGIGHGKREFAAFAQVLGAALDVYHNQEALLFIESGNSVVAEGTTFGKDTSGRTWCGGETPGGRFCSVYEIRDGRIARSYIYADPDYTSRHEEDFLWGVDRTW